MKKFFVVFFAFFPLVFLSGCSISQTNKTTTKNPDGSLWKSSDGGQTWEVKNNGTGINFSNLDILTLAVSQQDANLVYAGTLSNGILKSQDGGANWQKMSGLNVEKVYGLAIDPSHPNILYASGLWEKRGKIFKSSDGGDNWDEIYTTPSEGPLIVYLAIDENNPKILFASSSDNQIFKTSDAGISWKKIYSGRQPITKIAIDKNGSASTYFVTLNGDILKTSDGGKTVKDITQNVSSFWDAGKAITIETDPNHSGWVYVAGSLGIVKSQDGGKKWNKITTLENAQNFPVKTLAIKPGDSNTLEYGSSLATYRSVDGGNAWITYQFEYSKAIQIIRYAPNDGQILYLGFKKQ